MSGDDKKEKEIDEISGVETTGHEWDGLKELNNPAPRWWLWVFYICIIWSVGYWIVYPAWPTLSGATKGAAGWTQYKKLEMEQAEIAQRQAEHLRRFESAEFEDVMKDPALYNFAAAGGKAAFKDNCATCHGSGGAGGKGYPNLNDDDWLWGGSLSEIYQTLLYGIRSGHEEARFSQMPAFGKDGFLTREQVGAAADYVLGLQKGPGDETHPGYAVFQTNCASCHGADGKGKREFGAPDLTDAIWLYGGSREAVYKTIYYSRAGVMPYWQGRLDGQTLRQLTVYLHSLGGTEENRPDDRNGTEETGNAGSGAAE